MIERGGERAGDAALHVDRAAAVELAVGDRAGEGRMLPCRLVARRHHVGMSGEHQVGRGAADAGVEILHIVGARLLEGHAEHGEAGGLEHTFEIIERAAFIWRDRAATQQIAGNGEGIGGHDRAA